ncbi:acetyl-CoA C-acetyltransferase [Nocardia arthritidis]|uniref:Acetyl-CoA C-acetyltransferase n=2 Tax=Nocardiaceae TaxID=85025 RepID=A0A6G9Y4Z8_9NOCA|nr:acetyl-CoA C-acetyltransferase [Nocardia arthritidis]
MKRSDGCPVRPPHPRKENSDMTTEAYIFEAIRTPRGRNKKGSLHSVKPIDLTTGLVQELRNRFPNLDEDRISDLILGVVSPVGDQGADIARTTVLTAGLPDTVGGFQLNRFCASGLEAVNLAAQKVRSGFDDLVIAGGVESMSRVPMGSDGGAWAMDPATSYDTYFVPQGISADLIATIEGFTRDDVDAYAVRSQELAAKATTGGYFAKSIVPVKDLNGLVVLDRDEHMRPGTTVEDLAKLNPSFAGIGDFGGFDAVALQKFHFVEKINHVHHGGNSSGIVDGAALVLVGTEEAGKASGLTPKARIVATATSGADPTIMLTGPTPAAKKALAKAGLTIDDIDLVEINEAFASVVLKFQKDLQVPDEKLNVNGGAIAMGHPLGATGAMITGTMVDELERRNARYALITLCIGGGMGVATIIERV